MRIKNSKILILLDNPFTNDRRVYREAKSLIILGCDVTLVCVKKIGVPEYENIEGIEVYRIFEMDIFDIKKTKCFNRYASIIKDKFSFDIMHANDQTMLHSAVKIKTLIASSILVYDSHELFHAWPLNISNYNSKWIWLKSFIVSTSLNPCLLISWTISFPNSSFISNHNCPLCLSLFFASNIILL